jgi:hypothetical protein
VNCGGVDIVCEEGCRIHARVEYSLGKEYWSSMLRGSVAIVQFRCESARVFLPCIRRRASCSVRVVEAEVEALV